MGLASIIAPDRTGRRALWGDGSDGSIAYCTDHTRWEDGLGVALGTVAGKWTVAGATLTLHRPFQFRDVTVPAAATLQAGTDHTHEHLVIRVCGRLSAAGEVAGGCDVYQHSDPLTDKTEAAEQAAAGNGNAAQSAYASSGRSGKGGIGGAGGGDGTNTGGGGRQIYDIGWFPDMYVYWGSGAIVAGDLDAGANGGSGMALPTNAWGYESCLRRPGHQGWGGGGGALKQAGGTNVGGAGGVAGAGGGVLDIRAYDIVITGSGSINADGEDGSDGDDGVATNAGGDISGGGAGGGGGGGGTVCLGFHKFTYGGTEWVPGADVSSYVHAAGGTGGTGGAGEEFNGAARATSNGGNGGTGSAGLVCCEKLA